MLRKGDPWYGGEQVKIPSFAEAWDRTLSRMSPDDRSEEAFDAALAETERVAKVDFGVLAKYAEKQRPNDPRQYLLDLLTVMPEKLETSY